MATTESTPDVKFERLGLDEICALVKDGDGDPELMKKFLRNWDYSGLTKTTVTLTNSELGCIRDAVVEYKINLANALSSNKYTRMSIIADTLQYDVASGLLDKFNLLFTPCPEEPKNASK